MMRIKKRLIEEYLPIYLRESLIKENERLMIKIRELETHIKQLDAYIDGLEYGIRSQRRIIIHNGEMKK